MTKNSVGRLVAHGLTEVGKVRKHNEDSIGLFDANEIWVVADGMGGHSAGDYASQQIVEAIGGIPAGSLSERTLAMEATLQQVNAALVAHGQAQGGRTVGSTVVACVADAEGAIIAWAGDSRAYLSRNGVMEQINNDHSFVAELVKAGTITEDEAESHPAANVVTRAVGGDSRLCVDYQYEAWQPGDRILLCSDGLSKELPASKLAQLLAGAESPQAACEQLRDAVYEGRCSDNLSVIVIEAMA
ncbi:MAG: PP2C family protein-serine/threonine phosphatase [Oceanococcaceae bacterium]